MDKVVGEGEFRIFDAGKSSSNSCIHQRIGVRKGRIPVKQSKALLQDFNNFARFVV